MERRTLLKGTLAGLGTAALAACSSPVGAGLAGTPLDPGTVDYWNLFGGGDGVRMTQMEDGYRQANPDSKLQAVTLAWGNPYYTKLTLATVGNKPPNVAVSHLTRMKTLQSAGLLAELHPEDLGRHGMSAEMFNQRAWQAGLVDNRIYAIPIDTHPFVLFYNTDICGKAGLLDEAGQLKPIAGPDALVDALTKVKQVTGQYGATHGINGDSATPWRLFQTLYAQLGGEVLADNGTRVVFDDAKAGQVLDLLHEITVEKALMPGSIDYQGAIALFASGAAGFHLNGEWEITTFQTAKMPFSMTLVPNVFGAGGQYAVQADSHTLVIPRGGTRDKAQLDRALGFIKSMLDQSMTWAEGGHVPAWLPTVQSDAYKKLTPQSNYAAAADAAVYDPPGWYSGSGSDFEILMSSAVAGVEAGQLSPAAAISQVRTKLSDLASAPSPV
ncbi:extracellular solute-binding protein [Actinoplanes sp. TBRC 11911]|uniref:extracellular solute-binding protein n=1 Tax=Actinoplanes sp. TBRC 11911 TaxID=2729386 RepID=UPI00145E8133|nr:extracellular solute-binding protein [Actinoplanes sp. TBRC 11911]NMO51923.1 extracellular solute-binding protein [Actinoplanes sp. TBRC 11911]